MHSTVFITKAVCLIVGVNWSVQTQVQTQGNGKVLSHIMLKLGLKAKVSNVS